MNQRRLTHLLGALACLVVLLLGWLGVNQLFDGARTAGAEAAAIETQNTLLEAQIERLAVAGEALAGQADELARLEREIPPDADYDEYLAELQELAAASGLGVTAFSVGEPEAYAPTDGADTGSSTETTADPTTESTEAAGSATAESGTGTATALGGGALLAVPITLTLTGDAAGFDAFIAGLQQGERVTTVTGIGVSGDSGAPLAGPVTATVTGLIWVLR